MATLHMHPDTIAVEVLADGYQSAFLIDARQGGEFKVLEFLVTKQAIALRDRLNELLPPTEPDNLPEEVPVMAAEDSAREVD